MARKNIIASHKMLDSVSLTSNSESSITNVINLDRASVSIQWSGSDSVGEVEFHARKKEKEKSTADTQWYTLDFGSSIAITGASGSHEVIFDSLDFCELKAVYTTASGTTGSLTAVISAKTVGA